MDLQELIRATHIRLMMIRMDRPNKTNCKWEIGLDDTNRDPKLNYMGCESEKEATTLLIEIITKHPSIKRGNDYGLDGNRKFVYILCR